MIVVSGHLRVPPAQREQYLASCVEVVRRARETPGCLDFAVSGDLVDPGRVNVLERWSHRAPLEAFRGAGPSEEQLTTLLAIDVAEHEVPDH